MHPNPPRPSAAISSRLLLILQGSSPGRRESNCRHDAVPCVCLSALVLRSVRPNAAQAALNADANPCAVCRAQVTAPGTVALGVRSAARSSSRMAAAVWTAGPRAVCVQMLVLGCAARVLASVPTTAQLRPRKLFANPMVGVGVASLINKQLVGIYIIKCARTTMHFIVLRRHRLAAIGPACSLHLD